MAANPIPGYNFGQPRTPRSPVTLDDLRALQQTVGWSQDDARILHQHREAFTRRAEQMVDSWRALIAAQPHLTQPFLTPEGHPDDAYKARVKQRFVQWVSDVCTRPQDQAWLDYQEEIGRRHTPDRKNQTDHANTAALVPLRYLLAFLPNVTSGLRRFFPLNEITDADLPRVEEAWSKAVFLHLTLWTRPYAKQDWW